MTQARVEELKKDDELYAFQFNSLIKKIKLDNKTALLQEGVIKVNDQHSLEQEIAFFILELKYFNTKKIHDTSQDQKEQEAKQTCVTKKFILFEVTKDDLTAENEKQIPYFEAVFKNFYQNFPDLSKSSIFLMPLSQCQNMLSIPTSIWAGFRRDHFVLVELDFINKKSFVHDSQSSFRAAFYPDAIKKIADQFNLQHNYCVHGQQNGPSMCGYFVHQYILNILALGNSADCSNIKLTANKDIINKSAYLSQWALTEPIPDNIEFTKLESTEEDAERAEEEFIVTKVGSEVTKSPCKTS